MEEHHSHKRTIDRQLQELDHIWLLEICINAVYAPNIDEANVVGPIRRHFPWGIDALVWPFSSIVSSHEGTMPLDLYELLYPVVRVPSKNQCCDESRQNPVQSMDHPRREHRVQWACVDDLSCDRERQGILTVADHLHYYLVPSKWKKSVAWIHPNRSWSHDS